MARAGRGFATDANSAGAFGDGGTRARNVDGASNGARGATSESTNDGVAGVIRVDHNFGHMADFAVDQPRRGKLAESEFCAYVPYFDWLHDFELGSSGHSSGSFGRTPPF